MLPVEELSQELRERNCVGDMEHCIRDLEVELLPVWMIFYRELGERGCWLNGRACCRELNVEAIPVEDVPRELGERGSKRG